MKDMITLKGLVLSKYASMTQFAAACGHSKQWASRVLRNPMKLSIGQAREIREILGLTEEQMPLDIFLPR